MESTPCGEKFVDAVSSVEEPLRCGASTAGGFPTPDALLGETRQMALSEEPPQRTGSPRPHWLLRRYLALGFPPL
ncbi:MAG: hypothetical protein HC862_28670 [Scytonema sp. RU_4_4]|nr:hypothetical protein [Scytonema sp. RU_4_4]